MPATTTKPPTQTDHAPLTRSLADLMRNRWDARKACLFEDLADAAIDCLCAHMRKKSGKLDKRLADAIEDHLDHDPLEGDVDGETECSVEEIESWRGRMHARGCIEIAKRDTTKRRFTKDETAEMVGAMLRRPHEVLAYIQHREFGHDPAAALAFVLNARKEAKARNAHDWNGGKL